MKKYICTLKSTAAALACCLSFCTVAFGSGEYSGSGEDLDEDSGSHLSHIGKIQIPFPFRLISTLILKPNSDIPEKSQPNRHLLTLSNEVLFEVFFHLKSDVNSILALGGTCRRLRSLGRNTEFLKKIFMESGLPNFAHKNMKMVEMEFYAILRQLQLYINTFPDEGKRKSEMEIANTLCLCAVKKQGIDPILMISILKHRELLSPKLKRREPRLLKLKHRELPSPKLKYIELLLLKLKHMPNKNLPDEFDDLYDDLYYDLYYDLCLALYEDLTDKLYYDLPDEFYDLPGDLPDELTDELPEDLTDKLPDKFYEELYDDILLAIEAVKTRHDTNINEYIQEFGRLSKIIEVTKHSKQEKAKLLAAISRLTIDQLHAVCDNYESFFTLKMTSDDLLKILGALATIKVEEIGPFAKVIEMVPVHDLMNRDKARIIAAMANCDFEQHKKIASIQKDLCRPDDYTNHAINILEDLCKLEQKKFHIIVDNWCRIFKEVSLGECRQLVIQSLAKLDVEKVKAFAESENNYIFGQRAHDMECHIEILSLLNAEQIKVVVPSKLFSTPVECDFRSSGIKYLAKLTAEQIMKVCSKTDLIVPNHQCYEHSRFEILKILSKCPDKIDAIVSKIDITNNWPFDKRIGMIDALVALTKEQIQALEIVSFPEWMTMFNYKCYGFIKNLAKFTPSIITVITANIGVFFSMEMEVHDLDSIMLNLSKLSEDQIKEVYNKKELLFAQNDKYSIERLLSALSMCSVDKIIVIAEKSNDLFAASSNGDRAYITCELAKCDVEKIKKIAILKEKIFAAFNSDDRCRIIKILAKLTEDQLDCLPEFSGADMTVNAIINTVELFLLKDAPK